MKKLFFLKNIRNKFFNKLLLIYVIIIICSVSALTYLILFNLSILLKEQALDYNSEVIKTVSNYFYTQCENYKNIQNSIYYKTNIIYNNNTKSNDFFYLLKGNYSLDSSDYITKYFSVYNFLSSSILYSDSNIEDVFLIKNDLSWSIQLSKEISQDMYNNYSVIKKVIVNNKNNEINSKKIRIIPAFAFGNYNKGYSYAIYDYFRNEGGNEYYGYLAYTYDTENIKQSYIQFSKYLLGSILVITPDGKVIFDSSNKYYGKTFPYYTKMLGLADGTFGADNSIINYTSNNTFGFITVGIIPNGSAYGMLNSLSNNIIYISLASILGIILFTLLITRLFSKRIKNIVDTIKEIQKGNFAIRAETGGGEDEIQLIAANLNIMSQKIDEHIKREYISELLQKDAALKQKIAELYALQAQINPHFLYNTLETIRMRALSTGDTDVSQMIKILARQFRSSLKAEMIITIKEELQNCKNYLELMNIRFGDRLKVGYDVDQEILNYAIPKHLLQPIIENSIVHGSKLSSKNNTVTIKGSLENEDILITVSDNGEGITEQALNNINEELNAPCNFTNNKIGIFNVNSRIKLIFGNECGLKISSKAGEGTEVVIIIKARKKEEL
jgi:two-component system sensor histidine kinase YesM